MGAQAVMDIQYLHMIRETFFCTCSGSYCEDVEFSYFFTNMCASHLCILLPWQQTNRMFRYFLVIFAPKHTLLYSLELSQ